MELKNDAQAVIDAVERLSKPDVLGFDHPHEGKEKPIMVMLLPSKDGIRAMSAKPFIDEYLERPRRLVGIARAETLQSFCAQVLQHKTLSTVVFATGGDKPKLEAVIDYHAKSDLGNGSTPSFCGHRILYSFPISPELASWQAAATWRGQNAFAQLLDLRRFDIVDPIDVTELPEKSILRDVLFRSVARDKRGDLLSELSRVFASPGDLMQLVESLSGHSKTRFAEVKTDRFGGMRATIEKEGRIDGDEKIPSLFLVQVAAFVGGDKLTLPARIRARIGDRGLELAAELVGVERVLEAAFEAAIAEAHALTGCAIFRGSPEA